MESVGRVGVCKKVAYTKYMLEEVMVKVMWYFRKKGLALKEYTLKK